MCLWLTFCGLLFGQEGNPELHLHQAAIGTLSSSAPAVFRLNLQSGEYFRILVNHRDLAIRLAALVPDGTELAVSRSFNVGPTAIAGIAPRSGSYEIQVFSQETDSTARSYSLRLVALAKSTGRYLTRLRADQAYWEAQIYESQGTQQSLSAALPLYRASLRDWLQVNDRGNAALARLRLGDVYQSISDFQNALAAYRSALAYAASDADDARIDSLNALGAILITMNRFDLGKPYAEEALAQSQLAGRRDAEAFALTSLGAIAHYHSDESSALAYFTKALATFPIGADRRARARTLTFIGYAEHNLGDLKSSLDSQLEALSLYKSIRDFHGQADALQEIGNIYSRIEDRKTAFEFHQRALALYAQMGNRLGEAFVLDDLGFYYEHLGDSQRASGLYTRSALLAKALGNPLARITALSDLVRADIAALRPRLALIHCEEEFATASAIGDPRLIGFAQQDMGETFFALSDFKAAREYYEKSLKMFRTLGDPVAEAEILSQLAESEEQLGHRVDAMSLYQTSFTTGNKIHNTRIEADALYHIALLQSKVGHLDEARATLEDCLGVAESLRASMIAPDLRTHLFADVHHYYELYIDILMRLHFQRPGLNLDKLAFETSERSRARSLVELLHRFGKETGLGADPLLTQREVSLRQVLAVKAEEQGQLLSQTHDKGAEYALASQIADLSHQYERLEADLRAKESQYGTVPNTPSLKTSELQELLGEDDLLLEYSLGDQRSYLWSLTRTGFKSYTLNSRGEIENLARRLRTSLLLTNRYDSGERWKKISLSLSRLVLAPVSDVLPGKRLLIVSEGALGYVPFALLASASGEKREIANTLSAADQTAVNHEMFTLPSLGAVFALRQRRIQPPSYEKQVAVFADPVFERDDARFRSIAKHAASSPKGVTEDELRSAMRDAALHGTIPRLWATREEAEAIASFSREDSTISLDFDANRTSATSSDMAKYRIVHFATHALVDAANPELSGIVLSRFDRRGNPIDGYLRLEDIYGMHLSAELVVLSACNTALGQYVKGEGIIGLTRAFMYAGVPRVVATLWKVDDDATSEFMKGFYHSLLAEHRPPGMALREAQVHMMKEKRWHSPYYWAGFVLEGDWK
jgi:CHAT domain-containing protein/tetratricopeptide (TPR) repeat protein